MNWNSVLLVGYVLQPPSEAVMQDGKRRGNVKLLITETWGAGKSAKLWIECIAFGHWVNELARVSPGDNIAVTGKLLRAGGGSLRVMISQIRVVRSAKKIKADEAAGAEETSFQADEGVDIGDEFEIS